MYSPCNLGKKKGGRKESSSENQKPFPFLGLFGGYSHGRVFAVDSGSVGLLLVHDNLRGNSPLSLCTQKEEKDEWMNRCVSPANALA